LAYKAKTKPRTKAATIFTAKVPQCLRGTIDSKWFTTRKQSQAPGSAPTGTNQACLSVKASSGT